MKTAILLIGNVRTWDYCKENFKHTFSKYNPDIYVVVDSYRYGHHPVIQNRINDSSDETVDVRYLTDQFCGFNVKFISIRPRISQTYNHVSNKFSGMETVFSQVEKLKHGVDNLVQEYDLVIKTRCDMLYKNFEIGSLENKKVIIDSGNVYPNDCVIISNHENMKKISEFMYEEMFNPLYEDSNQQPPHGLLNNAFKHLKLDVEKKNIMDCVVRKGNKKEYY